MKILYVSQYFPPEIGAPAARVSQMAAHWRRWGHDVRVLTGFPNHPEGVVPAAYRRKLWRLACREEFQSVPVYRTWLYPAKNQGVARRSANYASFALSALLRGAALGFRPEAVIGSSPQLLCAWAASWIARLRGSRFVFEVRDLWPESLEAVGVAGSSSCAYRALDRIAQRLYGRAWKVAAVTEEFVERIAARGVDPARIAVVKNGVDTEMFRPGLAPPEDLRRPELEGKFLVSYVGTLGMAHALGAALEAAAALRDEPRIHFLLVGGGAERENLERRKRELRLPNVTLTGPRPWSEIPRWLAASDAALIHLARKPLFETVIPSKMFEMMAAGRPVLLGVRGEARRLLEEAGAGIAFEPESPGALRDAVLRLYTDAGLRRRLGEQGRAYVESNCSYERRAREYLEAIQTDPAASAVCKDAPRAAAPRD